MTPTQYATLVVMLGAGLILSGLAVALLVTAAGRACDQNALVNADNQKLFSYHETARQLLTLATASAKDAAQAAAAVGRKADDAAAAARLVADGLAAAGGPVPVVSVPHPDGSETSGVVVKTPADN